MQIHRMASQRRARPTGNVIALRAMRTVEAMEGDRQSGFRCEQQRGREETVYVPQQATDASMQGCRMAPSSRDAAPRAAARLFGLSGPLRRLTGRVEIFSFMDRHPRGMFDAKPDGVGADLDDSDDNVVVDHNAFIFPARYDDHGSRLLPGLPFRCRAFCTYPAVKSIGQLIIRGNKDDSQNRKPRETAGSQADPRR
jgi:hypothetical protein